MASEYFKYWGKAARDGSYYHPLIYHSLDVAAVGIKLAEQLRLSIHFSERLACEEQKILQFIAFLCAIHDIGKFSDGFQNQRPDLVQLLRGVSLTAAYQEKHWSSGYRLLRENAHGIFNCDTSTICDFLGAWLSASSGHHGRPPMQMAGMLSLSAQFSDKVKSAAIEYICEARDLLYVSKDISFLCIDETLMKELSWQVAGLTILADWIGSNTRWFPYCQEDPQSIYDYWQKMALPQADKAINESGVVPLASARPRAVPEVFEHIKNITPVQQYVENVVIDNKPSLFILEEITGAGKTEAALILAHRMIAHGNADGIYFGLPTMATANAMHQRVETVYRKFYADNANPVLILAHSASRQYLAFESRAGFSSGDVTEDAEIDARAWFYDNRKKALLANVGVGTIDQALLAVLPARHQSLRLLGLHRKVLIVDEVHAYDSYMNKLLRALLTFHAAQGGSAILLSATLPKAQRVLFLEAFAEGMNMPFKKNTKLSVEYPLITAITCGKIIERAVQSPNRLFKEVIVTVLHKENEVYERIKTALENGKSICWVRNTVFDAQKAYTELIDNLGIENVSLFHARFALGNRLLIEKQIVNDFGPASNGAMRTGKAVIATQVVEQSLDIDFDCMISDLAPIDLIIQRTGRLCRHARDKMGNRINGEDERGEPEIIVYMPRLDEEISADWYKSFLPKAAGIYEHHGQLWLTARWLMEKHKFRMPQDARAMIESVYEDLAQESIPSALAHQENRAGGSDRARASVAQFQALKLKDGYMPNVIQWQDDEKAPTRIGDIRTTLRLAVWDNGELVPYFCSKQGNDWMLSEVSVSQYWIKKEDEASQKAIEKAKSEMPDKGKFCVVVVLEENNGMFKGYALNARDERVTILYDTKIGLRVKEQGDDDELD